MPTSAVWGSVSCSRTLWHAELGNRTSDVPITKCCLYPWARAMPPSHTHTHTHTHTCTKTRGGEGEGRQEERKGDSKKKKTKALTATVRLLHVSLLHAAWGWVSAHCLAFWLHLHCSLYTSLSLLSEQHFWPQWLLFSLQNKPSWNNGIGWLPARTIPKTTWLLQFTSIGHTRSLSHHSSLVRV